MINPLLIWFLPLALAPVILHLITRRRLRTVSLSTFRFLMDSYVQQRRRLRVVEMLVMLLRVAFLALIVVAMARPIVHGLGFLAPRGAGRDVVLIIDAGATMQLRSAGTTSLERALGAAAAILGRLGPEDHASIIAAGREPRVVAQGFAGPGSRLAERLEGIETSWGAANLDAALREALGARARGARTIYIISDTMRPAWLELARRGPPGALEKAGTITVMNVGPVEPVENVAIVGEPPRPLRAVRGLPLALEAVVVNQSAGKPAETVLSLHLGGRHVDQAALTLPPGGRVSRTFHVVPEEAGLLSGRFEIGPDAFPEDNVFRFVLPVQESIRVLLVHGPPGERPGDRPETYIRAALEAPQHAARPDPRRVEERTIAAALEIRAVPHDALTPGELETADVVLLADAPLDEGVAALLRDYVEGGGGLMILPGPHSDPGPYNDRLLADCEPPPPALGGPFGDEDDESGVRIVTDVRHFHPVLAAFAPDDGAPRDGGARNPHFHNVRVYRGFALAADEADVPGGENPGAAGAETALLRLSDGTALLSESRLGEGRILVMGTPATPGWSNLPLMPEFVPLMLRAAAHLQRPPDAAAPSAVSPGQPAAVRLTDRWPRAQVQAVCPDGRRHSIELHRSGRRLAGAFRDTHRTGDYRFEVLPRHPEAPERIELGFAVNFQMPGTALAPAPEEDVRAALAPAGVVYLRGSADDPLLVEQLAARREIWRALIWLVFGVIGIEFLMATLRPARPRGARSGFGAEY